jgi:cytochrome c biogenesis protein CcmG, thiol:disulfide interchange protein DsbE
MTDPASSEGKLVSWVFAGFLALMALGGVSLLPRVVGGGSPLEGKPAPDAVFAVAANGDPGARMQVGSLKGHPVVLDFWASWCGPCAAQAPILDRIARRYEKQGLIVLGVNAHDPPAVAKSYATKKGLSYPIVIDAGQEAAQRYDVRSLPSLVVIDREGRVVRYMTGLVDEASLDEIVATTL